MPERPWPKLDGRIAELNERGFRLASASGMNPARLSQIRTGAVKPTDDEKQRIANALGMPVHELFIPRDRLTSRPAAMLTRSATTLPLSDDTC